jgi:NAD(P)-dependent dehydrogenase (short-subunit alcohol dehydrogenase family)
VPTLLTFGGRGIGRATALLLAGRGWNVAAFTRTDDTIRSLQGELPALLGYSGDAAEPEQVENVFAATRERFGDIDLVLISVTPSSAMRPRSFGPLIELPGDALGGYLEDLLPAIFTVQRIGGRVLAEQGHGTMLQATGGAARRGRPGIGPWTAAAQATRALTQTAALELREQGVHVALLIIDAGIQRPGRSSDTPNFLTTDEDVAAAVAFLAEQPPTGWTHELTITPAGDRWTP